MQTMTQIYVTNKRFRYIDVNVTFRSLDEKPAKISNSLTAPTRKVSKWIALGTTIWGVRSFARFWREGFGEFPRLVGRYCNYLLPKQAGGTTQILAFKTLRMIGRPALYRSRSSQNPELRPHNCRMKAKAVGKKCSPHWLTHQGRL